MLKRDIIVIGASAGGIEATHRLLKVLPADLNAAVFIVIHLSPNTPSVLARILSKDVKMTVCNPEDGQKIEMGRIYVAPPNWHLILKPGMMRLGSGPRENRSRPSVDALFRTAAFAYGERVLGVILSGALNDGTAGLMAIKAQGGMCIVQTPEEATFVGMPKSAIEFTQVDFILEVNQIAEKIIDVTKNGSSTSIVASEQLAVEASTHEFGAAGLRTGMPGSGSCVTCPECGGVLWEVELKNNFRELKCHVGHSFTPETMLQEQADAIDASFWKTLRQLEENVWFRRKLAEWARAKNKLAEANFQEEQAKLAEEKSDYLRKVLLCDVNSLKIIGGD